MAISPTGQFVAAALDSNTPVLLDARNGEVLATLTCPQNESIRKMAFAPDESLLVIAGARNIEVWDLRELDTQMHERGLAKGNLRP